MLHSARSRYWLVFAPLAIALIACADDPAGTTEDASTPDAAADAGLVPRCGDGTRDPGEQCDDGNTSDGDGCSADCRSDETCGNGFIDGPVGEVCDDGAANSDSLDGACATDCSGMSCLPGSDEDRDGDGFTRAGGDCDDCDPKRNPGRYDHVNLDANGDPLPDADQVDEDCDGLPTLPGFVSCDDDPLIALDATDPMLAAQAIDLCALAQNGSHGVISAAWVQLDGAPSPGGLFDLGHALLPDFGAMNPPQRGQRLLAISSGFARRPGDPGFENVSGGSKNYSSSYPPGLPFPSAGCPAAGEARDAIALELVIRAPTNASGFTIRWRVYFADAPEWRCTFVDDAFVIWMDPPPPEEAPIGSGNIAVDQFGEPPALNNVAVEHCGGPQCPFGTAELQETGFESDGATSWFTATATVPPGSTFTLRIGVTDAADNIGATTALVDAFEWTIPP